MRTMRMLVEQALDRAERDATSSGDLLTSLAADAIRIARLATSIEMTRAADAPCAATERSLGFDRRETIA